MTSTRARVTVAIASVACIASLSLLLSCKGSSSTAAAPSASTSTKPAPVATEDLYPLSDDQVSAIVNPSNAPQYTGPTGAIEGTIHVTGGPPTMKQLVLPVGCEKAGAIAGPSYRAGPNGELADVLVAAIGVSGFIRPSRTDREVVVQDCAIDPTAIDLSIGQRLMVSTTDDQTYIPQIASGKAFKRLILKDMPAAPVLIAKPGVYQLTWFTNVGVAYPSALVYVLPNALHTVTSSDGKFRIANVPVGPAHVTAAHIGFPEVAKDIDVKAGDVVQVDLTMTAPAPAAPPPSTSTTKPLLH